MRKRARERESKTETKSEGEREREEGGGRGDALLSNAAAAVSNIVGGAEVSSTLHPAPCTLNPQP